MKNEIVASNRPSALALIAAAACLLGHFSPAAAQGIDDRQAPELEEIVVTGSYLRRGDYNSPAPIQVLSRVELEEQGIPVLSDVVKSLTINNGSRFAFDQSNGGRGGLASFNLRGLGSEATLTLMNGRRLTPRNTNANVYPLNALERIEVLKDGASALYGSDAVAGVVNLVTRHVDGFELDAQYMTTTELGDESEDRTISGAWGQSGANTQVSLFFTYFERSKSATPPRFRETTSRTIRGFPGNFIPQADVTTGPFAGTSAGTLVADPACGLEGTNTFVNSNGECVSPIVDYLDFIANHEQFMLFVRGDHTVSDRLSIYGEFNFSDLVSRPAEWIGSRNFTGTVPADHPNNVFGVEALYLGRPFDPTVGERDWETLNWRGVGGVSVDFAEDWNVDTGYVFSKETINRLQRATQTDFFRVNDALNGVGGQRGDQYVNPFGTSLTDPSAANDRDFLLFLSPVQMQVIETRYTTLDAVVSGELFELPGGSLGLAVGAQYRDEVIEQNFDPLILGAAGQRGRDPSTQPRPLEQDVGAAFVETALPVADGVEISLAVRHEDYGGGIGDTTDPKVAARWQVSDSVAVRGSWGTSFRAPRPDETDETAAGRVNLPYVDPFSGTPGQCNGTEVKFADGFFTGNADLTPEDSTNFNLGLQFEALDGLNVGIDYWNFEFEDLIRRSNGQNIINADCADDGIINDPRIRTDPLGNIVAVDITLDNLAALDTDGVDLNLNYQTELLAGTVTVDHVMTYVNSYEIQETPDGPVVEGAGSRNELTNGVSMPEWRSNTQATWMRGNHSVSAIARYISSYDEDATGTTVPSHLTYDARYGYTLGDLFGFGNGATLEVGAINILDREPPPVPETWGFDSSVHDPRGRMVYFRLRSKF